MRQLNSEPVRYNVNFPDIWFTVQQDNSIRMHIDGDSIPFFSMEELVKGVEKVIGKGSYLKRFPSGKYARDERGNNIQGSLGYYNNQLKKFIVSAARQAALAAGWPEASSVNIFYLAFDEIVPEESVKKEMSFFYGYRHYWI